MKDISLFLLLILGVLGAAGSIALAENHSDSCVVVDEALHLTIHYNNINGAQYQGRLIYTGEKHGLYFWDYTGGARPKPGINIKPEQCGTMDPLSNIKFPCVKLVDGRVILAELPPVTTGDIKNRWVLKTLASNGYESAGYPAGDYFADEASHIG
ncbi:MAG: hypothetical protein HON51_09520 [Gammaproteobacteria bacterium]|jgi:hypothetical protein|nr:hypothetical protein [Gammaproteobacteria bacterium]MBT5221341.1 hypothetical protein [Gammaproteobacteria bacterium]MBT5826945.1 hypothetical protein [Gammaproteobacteria bacterium]MBT6419749.1 hypothetical protein [Gammaproteobacteria bacterium]MBT6576447.1 hypothetical protein [Gammaproteobacteria bacterium]